MKQFVCKKCGLINNKPKIIKFPNKEDIKEINKEIERLELEQEISKKISKEVSKINSYCAFFEAQNSFDLRIKRLKLETKKEEKYEYYKCKECNHKNIVK